MSSPGLKTGTYTLFTKKRDSCRPTVPSQKSGDRTEGRVSVGVEVAGETERGPVPGRRSAEGAYVGTPRVVVARRPEVPGGWCQGPPQWSDVQDVAHVRAGHGEAPLPVAPHAHGGSDLAG